MRADSKWILVKKLPPPVTAALTEMRLRAAYIIEIADYFSQSAQEVARRSATGRQAQPS